MNIYLHRYAILPAKKTAAPGSIRYSRMHIYAPQKHNGTAQRAKTLVINDSKETYPKCSALSGTVNAITPTEEENTPIGYRMICKMFLFFPGWRKKTSFRFENLIKTGGKKWKVIDRKKASL